MKVSYVLHNMLSRYTDYSKCSWVWDVKHCSLPNDIYSNNYFCFTSLNLVLTDKIAMINHSMTVIGKGAHTPLLEGAVLGFSIKISDCENYFGCAGQNVWQAFNALPDILSCCQTFFLVDGWQISLVILVFLVGHFMCVELCWTKCPARSELSVGHQQKSAGHVRHVRHISRSLCCVNISSSSSAILLRTALFLGMV